MFLKVEGKRAQISDSGRFFVTLDGVSSTYLCLWFILVQFWMKGVNAFPFFSSRISFTNHVNTPLFNIIEMSTSFRVSFESLVYFSRLFIHLFNHACARFMSGFLCKNI